MLSKRHLPLWIGAVAVGAALAIVYAITLMPGVDEGDSAEQQYMPQLRGVCHPPGYAIQSVVTRGFTALPIPGRLAWRVNLLTMICGVACGLCLYAILWRLTDRVLPAVIGALLFGFSSIPWSAAVAPETYAFHSLFLLLGAYFAVRWASTGTGRDFCFAAAALGVCMMSRPSEIFVAPAFAALWVTRCKVIRVGLWQWLAAGALFVAPFAFQVGYVFAREKPELLHARDDALRDEILQLAPTDASLSTSERLKSAVLYSMGLKWAESAAFTWERFWWDWDKLGWLMSGRGAFGDRFAPDDRAHWLQALQQGRGVVVGPAGLLLAALAFWLNWRQWEWLLFAVLFIAGNTAFYLYHHPPDNLEFITPSVIGWSLLGGLGAAGAGGGPSAKSWRRAGLQSFCLVAPAFLLFGNFDKLDRSTPAEETRQQELQRFATAPFPRGCALLAKYDQANTYRYLLYVEQARVDIHVLIVRSKYQPAQVAALMQGLRERGIQVVLTRELFGYLPPDRLERFAARTPPELRRVGCVLLP